MDLGFILLLLGDEEERQRYHNVTRIRRRSLRDANNPLELPEGDFVRLFRVTREVAVILIEEIQVDVQRTRSTGLPVHIVVLTAVRFYAVGSYQRCIGQEYNLALGQKTVSKVVREVSRAIARRLFYAYVKFPGTAAERRAVMEGFQHKFGLPDCLGCVDCTHIAIVTPYNNNPNDPSYGYKNRKGFYSINTQFVCDVNCRLLNVNARFPGSTHDQFIFNGSSVRREMERLTDARIGKYYLIGDSGYIKEPYLITPILPTPVAGSREHNYNMVVSQTRNCIERTNGIIKAVFRCLRKDRVLHYQPTAAAYIIIACCTIYNMMHEYRLPFPDVDDDIAAEPVIDDDDDAQPALAPRAAALRRQQEIMDLINQQM